MRAVLILAVALTSLLEAQSASVEMLAAHNRVRAGVGVPPLEWSPQLAAVARQWANELATSGKFAHRPKSRYGENLFEMSGARATPADVVAAWADESKDFDAPRNACRTGKVCGHYTQLVWRNTTKVGCGVARRGPREIWVCNYDPPGNWVGERPY